MFYLKRHLTGLLLLLVIVSCISKKENEIQVVNDKHISGPIGNNNGGKYEITVADTIITIWSGRLKERLELKDTTSFSKFEIIKTKTQGEAAEDCYLLLTSTSDRLSAIAVMLELRGNQFYFDSKSRNNSGASQTIICKNTKTASGCIPAVILYNKQKRLICPNNDCEKTVSEILF